MQFELNSNNQKIDFLNTLYDFLSFSGDSQSLKRHLGLSNAVMLRAFITSFAEAHENEIIEFAKEYFK